MSEIQLPVTALYAGLLALMSVFVANRVLWARLRGNKVPEWKEETNLRIQGNFNENVPLAVALLLALEVGGLPDAWIHWFGGSLFLFRVLHAWGMSRDPGATYGRLIGAQGTFLLMSVMGMTAVIFFTMPRL
jgi:uncharacterized membrane protein YecN with MAPEG domain